MYEIILETMSCSRRLLIAIFVTALIISSYIIYDYDGSLRVLMVSNEDYRRMTDSLKERVETLKSDLNQIRSSHETVLSERDSTIRRIQEDSQRMDLALSEEKRMKELQESQLEKLSRSHQRQINELNQLRSQLDTLSQESQKLHHCQGQYEALLRMYHALSDNFQELQDAKMTQSEPSKHHSSSQSGVLQPANKPQSDPSSSSSSPSQKSNLEEPKIRLNQQNMSSTTTPKSSSHAAIPGAPVGVEPPAASKVRSPVRRVELRPKSDEVVESPMEIHQALKNHNENKHNLDLNYFDRADGNDLNEDFNDDDTEYDSYKKMNLQHPRLDKERDDVVFHIQQNYPKKPLLINPVLYDDDSQ